MIWSRLKNFKCPKCNELLTKEENGNKCSDLDCGFFITTEKFGELVTKMYKRGTRPIQEHDDEDSEEIDESKDWQVI